MTFKLLFSYDRIIPRWRSIPDPDISPPKSELGLAELFEEIRVTVDQEAQIVKAVFPNPPIVMQVFLQRVFAQSVSVLRVSPQCIFAKLSELDTAIHGTIAAQGS